MTDSITKQHVTVRRHERGAFAIAVIVVLLFVLVALAIPLKAIDCASPTSAISNTLNSAVQRANEQPGTGYIRNPRQ